MTGRMFLGVAVCLLVAMVGEATAASRIDGRVVCEPTGEPIVAATINVVELKLTLNCDAEGRFTIRNLEPGRYRLKVSHIGHEEHLYTLDVVDSDSSAVVIRLVPRPIHIDDLVVTARERRSNFDDLAEVTGTLSGRKLQQKLGQTLASTIKNEMGLALRSMGPAPARPVIRGLGGDRVVVAEDGVKITDLSGTSPDHAVTIEPLNLKRIEVLRGPAVLLHSPTTVGGVVNVIRQDIPTQWHAGVKGSFATYAESANEGGAGSLQIEVPLKTVMMRADIGGKHTSDLSTPIGVLQNSSSKDVDYGVGGSLPGAFGFVGGSFRGLTLDYGIPGGFIGAHPNGVNVEMEKRQHNLRSQVFLPGSSWEHIDLHFSRAYYRHKELESNGLLGSEFRIVNYLGRVQAAHGRLGPLNKGVWGGTFERRDFDVGGHVFTTPARSLRLAMFAFERIERQRFGVEAGLRSEYVDIDPEFKDSDASIGPVEERRFHTWSASVSVLYHWGRFLQMGMNVSRSARTPTIEELYSRGPHLAAYSYEIGNPQLPQEHGVGTELYAFHESSRLLVTLNVFRNDLDNYIIHSSTGDTNFATFLPVYAAEGVPALLYGAEGQLEYKLGSGLSMRGSMNYTRGKRTDSREALPQIPPLKGNVSLAWEYSDVLVRAESEWAAAQKNLAPFEEPTDGYGILNLEGQYQFTTTHVLHSFSLHLDNLFDQTYRNHLSRVKSVIPEAGRNLRLAYKLMFGI